MPILYSYTCTQCCHDFDAFSSMDDRGDMTCEKCGNSGVIKNVGNNGGFRLLGGGWESDGYTGILAHDKGFINQFGKQKDKD